MFQRAVIRTPGVMIRILSQPIRPNSSPRMITPRKAAMAGTADIKAAVGGAPICRTAKATMTMPKRVARMP